MPDPSALATADEPRPERWARARRLVPWVSLALAVGSAVSMDRSPTRAWLIATCAGAGWLIVGVFLLFQKVDVARLSPRRAWLARLVRASASWGAQSVIQLCLFFSLPFYARAATVPAHAGFVAVVAIAAALTLWTPWCDALMRRAVGAALLQAVAAFAGLGCVLPLLGVSNRASLLAAALAAFAGIVFVGGSRRWRAAIVLAAAAALGGAVLAGAARLVPPVPLHLVSGAIGTKVVDRTLVGAASSFDAPVERLVCFTAVAAPRGLRDRLRHVWRHDGARRAEVAVEIRGGRALGFRAWSWQSAPTPGVWTCTVETASGQLLGRVKVTVR